MGSAAVYVINAAITAGVALGAIGWWFASRRRAAADLLQRADERARQIHHQAERAQAAVAAANLS